jgi:hypothetical protein
MARDWIDPSQAAQMCHNMTLDYFRKRFINPETRTDHSLVIQRFVGPKGGYRYKVLTQSVVIFLQKHIIHEDATQPDKTK